MCSIDKFVFIDIANEDEASLTRKATVNRILKIFWKKTVDAEYVPK